MTIQLKDRRFLVCIFYESPWEILGSALWSIDGSNKIIREVKECSLRARLARWCEYRDHMWVERYAYLDRKPCKVWQRRGRQDSEGGKQ